MSIYLKDIEMPKERESFQITIKYNGLVFDTESGIQIAEAHEVPDHGRLGDLDEAIKHIPIPTGGATASDIYENIKIFLNNAPTIIPADKEK